MEPQPPYLRIAAELRRRILGGELPPGARVPSTRAITREWGVAMATATKVIAVLREEGLVRPVPGVGTVVTADAAQPPGPGPAPGPAGPLRDRIVATAIEVADAEGLAALSMRRVAGALGLSTMALYRHVRGKADLVLLMSDAALARAPLGPVPRDWRAAMEHAARWLRDAFTRHPWLTPAIASFTRPHPTPHAMAYTEWVLAGLAGTGLAPVDKVHVHLTLFAYVQGVATASELERRALEDTGLSNDQWMARNEPQFTAISAAGSYPLLNTLFTEDDPGLSLDSLFEFGLRRTLDGIAVLIAETSA
ncbi:TetR/AcrR family transcriptional regulator C-terminal domain-containing protein [Streptomyces sp. NPDC001941]|uniref:TetR/AcrR family transcriptional regulator C-terminal domain-containing protein n=1 Tax=Streptomyces sp. NPDC001941 TaxID=3154659 RepID=UPI003321F071